MYHEYKKRREFTQEEIAEMQRQQAVYNTERKYQSMSDSEITAMFIQQNIQTLNVTDDIALRMKEYYPTWESLERQSVDIGFKLTYADKLYKVRQKHTVQSNWKPNETGSLYEVINETYEGTLEEPIPYDTNMTVYNGQYYLYNNMIYKCIRDSGQPLYAEPNSLLGNYFEEK